MRAQLQTKRNVKFWLGAVSGGVILALSGCALSPLTGLQPNVSDSLAIENRQLRANDSAVIGAGSRRGGQRTSSDATTAATENDDKDVLVSPTPVVNIVAVRPAMAATSAPRSVGAVAKIVPKQAANKIVPKPAASGSAAAIAPTPVRAIGGGGANLVMTPAHQPQPTATATAVPDTPDPGNLPYATPVARNEALPTPKYPTGPVIYLPGKVLPTPVGTAAIVPTVTAPKAIPTNIANVSPTPSGYGKESGAGAASSPTPKVVIAITPTPIVTPVLK